MFQLERQNQILDYVNGHQKASTKELAGLFDTSVVTIRKDIDFLSGKGLLIKVHGGAISESSADLDLQDIPYSQRFEKNPADKQVIGRRAAELICDHDVIVLDSGSTTLEVARNIHQQNVTVVTNDIKIAAELFGRSNIKVQVPGGILDEVMYTLIDNNSCSYFQNIHVNKLFLSCDALDTKFGASNRSYEQGNIKKAMISSSDEVILVTDKSKFQKKTFYHVCDLSEVDTLVTYGISEDVRRGFQEMGIRTICADLV